MADEREQLTEQQMVHKMGDEREERMVYQKVHLMEYQKDHWVVSLEVPRLARRMVQKMEQMTKHQMVY